MNASPALASNTITGNTITNNATAQTPIRPDQRMGRKYRFDDADMDLFFMAALSWGPAGGLDIGQADYIASRITDGHADSWVASFSDYAQSLDAQADAWKARGHLRAAGETRLKAFAAYRSAWQFAPIGAGFNALYARHQAAFRLAMGELALPAEFFSVDYQGGQLPGVFLRQPRHDAPTALVIGGADTCFEDLYLSMGRNLFERGYSVALVDLPGQGNTAASGLHWEAQAERPIAAVIDLLIGHFGAKAGRIALIGLSLGGYFVARAAGVEQRVATVIASTPFPSPAQMFELSVRAAQAAALEQKSPTAASLRSRQVAMWKMGARTPQEFIERGAAMVADPAPVTVPFLSILGAGDSPVFAAQAHDWHARIRSERKDFVYLDEASGADGHVQVNNRLRLAQEACAWMDEIFAA